MRRRNRLSKALVCLASACSAAALLSCDAWNGGEVGIAPPSSPSGSWSGVKQFGTAAADFAADVATDASGNVYVASMDNQAVVVRKFAATGSLSWTSTQADIGANGWIFRVALSQTAIYVVGMTSIPVDNTGLGMTGFQDGFVFKFDLSGSKVGALQIRESIVGGVTHIRGVATDNADRVYIGGHGDFQRSFVAKYDWSSATPSQSWITRYGGMGDRYAVFGLALGIGLVHVVGPMWAPPATDFYIARFSTSTGAQSGSTITELSPGNDTVAAVASDAFNNTYVVGATDNAFAGANAGGTDVIAAKYDPAGNNVWRYQIGSARDESGTSIALSGTSVYLAGTTGGQFGGQTNRDSGLSTSDAFLIKLPNASTGPTVAAEWVRMYGSAGSTTAFDDWASGIATDFSGNIFVAGKAVGCMETATQVLGNGDGFVLKVSPAGVLQ